MKKITDEQVQAAKQAEKDNTFYSTLRRNLDDETVRAMLRAAALVADKSQS